MELALLIATFAGVVVAGAAAAAAIVQTRAAIEAKGDAESARDEARKARNEAAELAAETNDAFKRQAEALEESNRIARESLPKFEVKWAYEHVQGVLYVLRNIGTKVARGALITDTGEPIGMVRPGEAARDIEPGDSIEFRVLTGFGTPRPTFRVTWTEDDSTDEFFDDTRMIIRR